MRESKKYKANTIYTHSKSLLRFFREYYIHKKDKREFDKYISILKLFPSVRPSRVYGHEDIYTPSEFIKLIKKTSKYNLKYSYIMMFLYYTGVRIAEFTKIKISDVKILNKDDSEINIRNGKGNKERFVICPTFVIKLIKELNPKMYLFESSEFKNYSIRRIQTICRDAGKEFGKRLTPHLLRHSFATEHVSSGTNPEILAKAMGNSVMTIMNTYNHPKPDVAGFNKVLVSKTQILIGKMK